MKEYFKLNGVHYPVAEGSRHELIHTVFNPLSFTNDVPVTVEVPPSVAGVRGIPSSLRTEAGRRELRFVAPRIPPCGFREFRFNTRHPPGTVVPPFSSGSNTLEGPFYRLRADPQSGGLASLVHKPSGQQLFHFFPLRRGTRNLRIETNTPWEGWVNRG